MKKILLTLVGLVGLTGISRGQFTIPSTGDWANSLELGSMAFETPSLGAIDLQGNYTLISSYAFGGDSGQIGGTYSKDLGDGKRVAIGFIQMGPSYQSSPGSPPIAGKYEVQVMFFDGSTPYPNDSFMYRGDSLNSLSLFSSGIEGLNPPPSTFNGGTILSGGPFNVSDAGFNYPSGSGGDDDPDATVSVFVTQAEELNRGLEFNNGQWTVKQ
jgi:hypothetical protein